ncbi:FG-GAP repeat domain-containing protein [Streptomyces sp. NPDC053513]|uniref:FG-GAP repeat domain-containing protein n=1 Tax=unclassified Streptomyces TaxID=2593676 RepID=UPI0037D4C3E9
MRDITRRAATFSAAAGLLTAATFLTPHSATAADELRLTGYDAVAAPGSAPRFYPLVESGAVYGKVVIAVGTQPMIDPAGAGAGFPESYVPRANECAQPAGYTGIFVCDGPTYLKPDVLVPTGATDTTLYWGFAPLPADGDLAEAVRTARSAGSLPADAQHGTGKVTVKSAASAALNTVDFEAPDVPAGGTVRQQFHVHAKDAATVSLLFSIDEGQIWGWPGTVRLGNVTATQDASCSYQSEQLHIDALNVQCRVKPGDHTITYELTGAKNQQALRLRARTNIDIYDVHAPGSNVTAKSSPFTLLGQPRLPSHGLHARDTTGHLWVYDGTRRVTAPFSQRTEIGAGWQNYNALTSLSPHTQNLYYQADVKPSAVTRGRGDLVARDATGGLWYYDRQYVTGKPYASRVKVGGGWNIYDQITGAGDLDRDGFMDLLARDKAGALWLYQGTGSFTGARFKTRVRVGAGWDAYNRLAGGADVTGDGRADLLARDKAGVLWLYRGTGSGTAPYATRTRVGAGWGAYDQLVVAGDLTDDGRADLLARDKAGVLWLYRGTGGAGAPFATRTRIGGGWNTYDRLF